MQWLQLILWPPPWMYHYHATTSSHASSTIGIDSGNNNINVKPYKTCPRTS